MRFVLALFLAVIFSRLIAHGSGAGLLWSSGFSPMVMLVFCVSLIASSVITSLLLARLLMWYMLLHTLLGAAIVARKIQPHFRFGFDCPGSRCTRWSAVR